MPRNLTKLTPCILKEMCLAVVIVDIFQIFNVDIICTVLHLGVKCTRTVENIFAAVLLSCISVFPLLPCPHVSVI